MTIRKILCMLFSHQWLETGRDKRSDVDLVEFTCRRCSERHTVME